MKAPHLRCAACGRELPPTSPRSDCPCGGLLDVVQGPRDPGRVSDGRPAAGPQRDRSPERAGGTERGRRTVDPARFALGCALGAGLLGLLLAGGSLAGWVRWEGWGPTAVTGWRAAVQGSAIALCSAFLQSGGEEVIFRGYVLRNLTQWGGLGAAVAGSAVLFAVVHGSNPGAGPLAILSIAVIGIFLALLRARSSFWTVVGFHGMWNAGLMLLSLPCSGIVFGGLVSVELTGRETRATPKSSRRATK